MITLYFTLYLLIIHHTHHLTQYPHLLAGCARVGEGRGERVEVGDGDPRLRRRQDAQRRGR